MNINKTLIDALYDTRNMYKGRDGRSYTTLEELDRADEAWKREHLQYKGKDGKFYPTMEELDRANTAWKRETFQKK